MLDALIVLGSLGLWLYGLIDCARTEQDVVRNLPKWAWLIIIIFFGFLGAIVWLFVGRPKGVSLPKRKVTRVLPPDDNPDFLKQL